MIQIGIPWAISFQELMMVIVKGFIPLLLLIVVLEIVVFESSHSLWKNTIVYDRVESTLVTGENAGNHSFLLNNIL